MPHRIGDAVKTRFLFFGRHCGVHGLNHLFRQDASIIARLFWLTIIVASLFCLYLLLLHEVDWEDGVQYTPDTLYLNWTTIFPAVTVCDTLYPKGVTKALDQLYPDLMRPLNYDQKRYLVDLLHGRGKCSPTRCFPCGKEVPCDVPWRQVVDTVHKKCEEVIADCSYIGEKFSCCKIFHVVDSEYGPCFAFNSLQTAKFTQDQLFTVNRTTGPGELNFRLLVDSTISIHSIEELSTNNLDIEYKLLVPATQRAEILFSVVEMENDVLIKHIDISKRRCRFPHEVPDDQFYTYPIYSYGACKLAKSTEYAYEHCGCIAPQRDLSYKKYYCNYTGMNCLAQYEADMKIGLEKEEQHDNCLPSCIESELFIIDDRRTVLTLEERSSDTTISIKMPSLPSMRHRRDLERTDLDFVVSLGGMAGLFFSASVLSAVEIFYLLLRKPNKVTE